MSGLQATIEFARTYDALAFAVSLLFALWRRWLYLGPDVEAMKVAFAAQIAKYEEDAKEDKADNRTEREKNERLFEEFRQEMWRGRGR